MDETDQNRLTEGSVPRKMLAFALPIFLSNLFQQLYNAVDSLIVGNFIGSTALAAVGSSASMIMLLVGFINGVSLGAGVVIARFYGADDRENLSRALHTTVALGIAAGLVLTVVGVLLTPQILRWMGTPGDVIGNSIAYFRVYFLGSSAVVLYNMCASILQSVGDSRSPMKYLIFASLTNVVLDLLFVAVFRWGVASAALATILSQTLSALLAFRKLTHTGHSYRLSWRQVRFHGDMLRQVVYLGIPSGVQNSVISLANVIVQANINAFGSAAMAGCGAYSKIEGFAFLPVSCFSMALATFVSQNIGARRYDRVRSGIRFGLLCSPCWPRPSGWASSSSLPCWLPPSTAARRSSPTAWPTPGPSACSTSSWPSPTAVQAFSGGPGGQSSPWLSCWPPGAPCASPTSPPSPISFPIFG